MKAESLPHQTKLTTTVLTALTMLFLTTGIYFWKKSWKLAKLNDQNELRADSLLSAKLRLEGDVRSLESQLDSKTDENLSLDNRLTDIHNLVDIRAKEAATLRTNLTGQARIIQRLKQQTATVNSRRDSLENQLAAVRDKIDWLSSENKLLIRQKSELQQKIDNLQATILTKVSPSALTGDAFLVKATKENHKETAKARKVKRLTISLNLPAELQQEGVQDVYLSLTDSQHNSMMPPIKTATITLPDINELIPVHAVQGINFSRNPQRISFTISPPSSLKAGHYRASLFTKEAYLGSVEFEFRDSFLFF